MSEINFNDLNNLGNLNKVVGGVGPNPFDPNNYWGDPENFPGMPAAPGNGDSKDDSKGNSKGNTDMDPTKLFDPEEVKKIPFLPPLMPDSNG